MQDGYYSVVRKSEQFKEIDSMNEDKENESEIVLEKLEELDDLQKLNSTEKREKVNQLESGLKELTLKSIGSTHTGF